MSYDDWKANEPTDHLECQGCQQYEAAMVQTDALVERLERANADLQLKVLTLEAALNLAEKLLDAYKRRHDRQVSP